MSHAIVHVSDWNCQDKYYEAPLTLIMEFRQRIKSEGIENAWDWWVGNVNHRDKLTKNNLIKFGKVNMTLEEFFLDFNNPIESVDEWEVIC